MFGRRVRLEIVRSEFLRWISLGLEEVVGIGTSPGVTGLAIGIELLRRGLRRTAVVGDAVDVFPVLLLGPPAGWTSADGHGKEGDEGE